MKNPSASLSILRTLLVCAALAAAAATSAATGAQTAPGSGDELAVIRAMATSINHTSKWPYDYLYFESDFTSGGNVESSMANPDRTDFCGLSREAAQVLVRELRQLNDTPVEFDSATAKPAGLKLGRKKLERFRYLIASRVVFDATRRQAFVAVDLNGETGAVLRFDKIGNDWSRSARCGGWMKSE
jgi:hypothetical protein